MKLHYIFGGSGPHDSHKSLCQRSACMVGGCANEPGHPIVHIQYLLLYIVWLKPLGLRFLH